MTVPYTEHFGLKEAPFSLAPNPRYLYASEQHREALAHLVYGVRSEGGFILLTGEVGTGKTTIFRCLLERLPEKTKLAFVLHPKLSVEELLATICEEFGIDYPKGTSGTKTFVDVLNTYLLETAKKGFHAVLVIDEAQNLSLDVLEQLRLLTNLETNRRKLLQVILLGQPELRAMLNRPEMRQLSQRVTARYHLGSLPSGDVEPYVSHRLAVAGASGKIFSTSALSLVGRKSRGVPRVINLICDRALLGAFAQGERVVSSGIVRQAAGEVLGESSAGGRMTLRTIFRAASLLALLAVFIMASSRLSRRGGEVPPEEVAAVDPVRQEQPVDQSPPPVTAPAPAPSLVPVTPPVPAPATDSPPPSRRDYELEWLFGKSGSGSRAAAESALMETWGGSAQFGAGGGGLCDRAREAGLRCLRSRGSLADLRELNRPAILRFTDIEGKEFHAALTALNGNRATLIFEDGSGEIILSWFGEYTLLWRPPADYRRSLKPGQRGPAIEWVRDSIAQVLGITLEGEDPGLYDPPLLKAVKAFQASRSLQPDGILGPLTLIHLNTASGMEVPLLEEVAGEN